MTETISIQAVSQAYESYTTEDHQTWQRLFARLIPIWKRYAHPLFLEGLHKTGISDDVIPRIDSISELLKPYGWQSVPVDGFVPPRHFLGLQAQKIMPIARDIRRPQHLDYTPAPDIWHEAAGHVPLLVDPMYGAFLQRFGELALQVPFSEADQIVYEAIRHLSILKEHPEQDIQAIEAAEAQLNHLTSTLTDESIGLKLSRLYWWTVEYGLIETSDGLKIYGAGLLSSPFECAYAMSDAVEKRPLSLACLDVAFDITRPQPQLFVAESFDQVLSLLDGFVAQEGLLK